MVGAVGNRDDTSLAPVESGTAGAQSIALLFRNRCLSFYLGTLLYNCEETLLLLIA
jgi:hypothetical protein